MLIYYALPPQTTHISSPITPATLSKTLISHTNQAGRLTIGRHVEVRVDLDGFESSGGVVQLEHGQIASV